MYTLFSHAFVPLFPPFRVALLRGGTSLSLSSLSSLSCSFNAAGSCLARLAGKLKIAFEWRWKEATAHSANCAICACPATSEEKGGVGSEVTGPIAISLPDDKAAAAAMPSGVLECATCIVTCHSRCAALLSRSWARAAPPAATSSALSSNGDSVSRTSGRRVRARHSVNGSSASPSSALDAAWRCHLCRFEDSVDCVGGGGADAEGSSTSSTSSSSSSSSSSSKETPPTLHELAQLGAVVAGISLGGSVALDEASKGTVRSFQAPDGTFEVQLEDGSKVTMDHSALFERLWKTSCGQ